MGEQTLFGIPWSTFKALPAAEQARLHAANAPRRYTAAAPMPGQEPAPMPSEKTRQLREWGFTPAQIDDLARLTPAELAKIWPTPAELEANDKMGPGGPGVDAIVIHKAEQAGIKLPPDFAPASGPCLLYTSPSPRD